MTLSACRYIRRNRQANLLSGLQVNHQLELRRLFKGPIDDRVRIALSFFSLVIVFCD